ncbi:site-specific integrase [Streptomyces albofaciens JCM 4342]|uniref:tyrosine-type recombinase/integrase n=1 Tax=Streptomyces albofaciens TaxID=66866 RepID=UPI0012390F46|nr:site-specific integrase [Streptomyces albofaciens]KAA6221767.1 site-specific integrase [Streptomyces albofaciens JCM 4342]
MASIVERPKKGGTITYQVKWRKGGARGAPGQSEKFSDPESAKTFKKLVDAHGQHWPPGWVRGKGFVEPDTHPNDVPWVTWAERYVDRLTGIDDRTRDDYRREIRIHLSLLQHTQHSGEVVPATVCNVTADDVADWVRAEEKGAPNPADLSKWERRPADPKSVRNRHGLMFCAFQAAVGAKPPLRADNPCKGTRLPRVDDHVDEEMCFLERDEYQRIAAEITDPDARDLADWLVGTGMRWGEATALQVRDLNLSSSPPTATIHRAWKKAEKGSGRGNAFYLGPPKTKKARRVIALTAAQAETARRLTAGQPPEGFVFRAAMGGAWRHANFYNRKWLPAVKAAVAKGLPRRPRLHDLRHTHVAWLIAARIPLPAIQVRLGHESISTTVDRYGHLVRELDDEITAAVEAALTVPAPAPAFTVVPAV